MYQPFICSVIIGFHVRRRLPPVVPTYNEDLLINHLNTEVGAGLVHAGHVPPRVRHGTVRLRMLEPVHSVEPSYRVDLLNGN